MLSWNYINNNVCRFIYIVGRWLVFVMVIVLVIYFLLYSHPIGYVCFTNEYFLISLITKSVYAIH